MIFNVIFSLARKRMPLVSLHMRSFILVFFLFQGKGNFNLKIIIIIFIFKKKLQCFGEYVLLFEIAISLKKTLSKKKNKIYSVEN